MNKIFISDMDDTLVPNHHDYDYAMFEFTKFVFERIGYRAPNLQAIVNLQVDIDLKNFEKMGIVMERFPTSMKDAFTEICNELDEPYTEEDLEVSYKIGMIAFDEERWKKQGLLKGVPETLDFLVSQGDELALMTRGDKRVQEKKIEVYGLGKWFSPENIDIIENGKKDRERFDKLIKDDGKNIYHIGNSVRSDVNPALEAGLKAIYVPCETWAYERKHDGVPDHSDVINLKKFSDIQKVYHKL